MTYAITPADAKLFRGSAAGVNADMSPTEMLQAIDADFQVTTVIPEYQGREYPDCRLWLRSDNQNFLGSFGTRRTPQQPTTLIDHFRSFCAASEKAIQPDVIGTIGGGKTFYMASKLSGDNARLLDREEYGDMGGLGISRKNSDSYISKDDRTDFWLILMTHYGESLGTSVKIVANELVCSNALSVQILDKRISLSNRTLRSYHDVEAILNRAIRGSRAYATMKNRFIDTPLTITEGINAIRAFHADPDGESQTVKRLERIYQHDLIGGDLDTRQGNLWRLVNAQTQYTSHHYVDRNDGGKTFQSQVEGSKAKANRRFLDFLEAQFTPDLVAA